VFLPLLIVVLVVSWLVGLASNSKYGVITAIGLVSLLILFMYGSMLAVVFKVVLFFSTVISIISATVWLYRNVISKLRKPVKR